MSLFATNIPQATSDMQALEPPSSRIPGPRRRSLSQSRSGEDFAASGGVERNACRSPHPVADGIDSTTAHRHCRGSFMALPSLHHAPHRHFSRRRPPRDSRREPPPKTSQREPGRTEVGLVAHAFSLARISPGPFPHGAPFEPLGLQWLHPLARCTSKSMRRGARHRWTLEPAPFGPSMLRERGTM